MSSPMKLTDRRSDTDVVLTTKIADALRVHLPRRYKLATEMNLLYSLDQHGISLSTLYRQAKNTKGPIVLVVKDADDNVSFFFKKNDFLWKWNETESQIKTYRWTGKNEYMILSEPDFIAIGGGEGVFGLWLNSELEKGYSQPCPTFDNERLTPDPEFECVELEVWGFRM
ncbi:hypothetical protein INT48_001744 [Thamnidium elegans]|uniref:Oxidation resistance protein 1 n=1 Tax=Thamnidium elegans TaxID=101142 RepID=A0A8H7VWB5_9FUNG|nr:hypothetical protein INT48_001744 [Thamnidium elegans]